MPLAGQFSMLGSPEGVKTQTLQKITLSGFWNQRCNGDYFERPGEAFMLYDRPTYWSKDSSRALCFHAPSNSWILCPRTFWLDEKVQWNFHASYPFALCAPSASKVCTEDAPWTRWCESFTCNRYIHNKHARVTVQKVQIVVRLRPKSMLSTIPGGYHFLRHLKDSCRFCPYNGEGFARQKMLLVLQMMDQLPAVHGSLPGSLANSTDELDVAIWEGSKLFRAAELEDETRSLLCQSRDEEQSRRAAEEEHSRRSAEELLAEEERHEREKRKRREKREKAEKKDAHLSNKKLKSRDTKAKQAGSSENSAEEDANEKEDSFEVEWRAFHEDISDPVSKLRHNFPIFDDDVLSAHLMEASYDLEKAVVSLSKLEAEPVAVLEPADIPRSSNPPLRSGEPKRLMANVIARTDHPKMPLYCFIAVVAKSNQSQKYRAGQIVRPIPEDRFRLLGDEKGHFWLKKTKVPQIGDIVEVCFFEEDARDYLETAHGTYPHQNEDLLCTTLTLHSRCDLERNAPCFSSNTWFRLTF